MEQKDKELLERLNKKTADIKVPEKLSPQEIEQQLGQKPSRKSKSKYYLLAGVAAACLMLVGSVAVIRASFKRNAPQLDLVAMSMESTQLKVAKDYSEVYDYLEKEYPQQGYAKNFFEDMGGAGEMMREEAAVDMEVPSFSGADGGFSDTNTREETVGEADYIKTDGRYIYARKDSLQTIEIVDTKDNKMESVGSIKLADELIVAEFYIQDDKILILCNEMDAIDNNASTVLVTYDIKNRKKPEKIGEVPQSGNYHTSRVADGYIYIFSQYYAMKGTPRGEIETYIPRVGGASIAENNIVMPYLPMGERYLVITSVKIAEPTDIVDSKAVFNQGAECYVSTEHIYIYQSQSKWQWENEWKSDVTAMTNIQKLEYKRGELTAKAQNTIYGYLDSSFSIDEYDNHLRTVTTVQKNNEQSNAVYVLDENMEVVGRIEGLAKDERIYSARLMGELGYFVTFRETDPLFTVDFSNPTKPEIIGVLKIPGFSEYLHPYNEHLLLGIGMEVDEDTQVSDGVKISMFDISDPTDVKEIDKYVIKGSYSSSAFYDYKAVLVASSKDFVGFSVDTHRGERYKTFEYTEGVGFIGKIDEHVNGTSYDSTRGLYIGDVLYVAKGNIIEAYSLSSCQKIDDIIL